jgi:CBS domain-containing protein
MTRTGNSRLVVIAGTALVGIVSLKDLMNYLFLKLELEDREAGALGGPFAEP